MIRLFFKQRNVRITFWHGSSGVYTLYACSNGNKLLIIKWIVLIPHVGIVTRRCPHLHWVKYNTFRAADQKIVSHIHVSIDRD